jgi:hypothetical protein
VLFILIRTSKRRQISFPTLTSRPLTYTIINSTLNPAVEVDLSLSPENYSNAPSTASTTDTMPTGFFDLPRELRDEVYDHLWASMPRVLMPYSPKLRLKANFNVAPGPSDRFSSLPQGISASRSLLHEALSAFHRKGAVQVESYPGTPKPTYNGHELPGPRLGEAAFAVFKFSPPALTPLEIQQLHVNFCMTSSKFFKTRVGSYSSRSAIYSKDAMVLRHLVDIHARIGAPKSWKLHTNFRPRPYGQHTIDLGVLYDLRRISRNLTSVEIVLDILMPNGPLNRRLEPSLLKEIETLGQNVFPNFKATAEKVRRGDREVKWLFSFTKVED